MQWRKAFGTDHSLSQNPWSFHPSVPKKTLTDDQPRPNVSPSLLRAAPRPQNRPLGRPATLCHRSCEWVNNRDPDPSQFHVVPEQSNNAKSMLRFLLCISGVWTCLKSTTFPSCEAFFLHLHIHSVVCLLFPQYDLYSRFQLVEPPSLR